MSIGECLDETERNIVLAEALNLRNAGRCLADFARVVFTEIGAHYSGYQIVKEQSINMRFRMLPSLIPELTEYEAMFLAIDKLRNKTEHGDISIPSSSDLSDILSKAREFETVFESKIIPALKAVKTPKQMYDEEWKLVPPMIQALDQYAGWRFTTYDDLKPEIERLSGIYLDSDNLRPEIIQEARLSLRDLQFKMQERIREGEIEYHDAIADSYAR